MIERRDGVGRCAIEMKALLKAAKQRSSGIWKKASPSGKHESSVSATYQQPEAYQKLLVIPHNVSHVNIPAFDVWLISDVQITHRPKPACFRTSDIEPTATNVKVTKPDMWFSFQWGRKETRNTITGFRIRRPSSMVWVWGRLRLQTVPMQKPRFKPLTAFICPLTAGLLLEDREVARAQ